MFDLLLNAVRLAISEDARKSASSIVDLIKRSPEWQRDIFSLEVKIPRSQQEQAAMFSGLIASKMDNLKYSSDVIEPFRTSFFELTRNGFEHGCRTDEDAIQLIMDVTIEYVALTVSNPKKRKFAISDLLDKNRSLLAINPNNKRGRGLLLVNELADSLSSTQKLEGVKAVFYKDRVHFNVTSESDVTLISLSSGLHNPSMSRRLFTIASRYLGFNLILDFRGWIAGTAATFVILELGELYAQSGKQIIAISDSQQESEVVLPDAIIAYSLSDALEKLSRSSLLTPLINSIGTGRF